MPLSSPAPPVLGEAGGRAGGLTLPVYRFGEVARPPRPLGSLARSLSEDFDRRKPPGVQGRVGAVYAAPTVEGVAPWALRHLWRALEQRAHAERFRPLVLELGAPATTPVRSLAHYHRHDAEAYWRDALPLGEWLARAAGPAAPEGATGCELLLPPRPVPAPTRLVPLREVFKRVTDPELLEEWHELVERHPLLALF